MKSDNLVYYLGLAVAVSFVLPVPVSSISIGLFTLAGLLSAKRTVMWEQLKQPRFFLPLLLFGWVALSGLLSTDTAEGGHYTERKLSLLLFPLAFAGMQPLTISQRLNIVKAYCVSLGAAFVYCLAGSLGQYSRGASLYVFTYHDLAGNLHLNAIYFSAYCLLGWVLVWKQGALLFRTRALRLLLLVMLGAALLLLNSKMVLVLWLLYIAFGIVRKSGQSRLYTWGVAVGVLLLSAFALWQLPFVRERVLFEMHSNMHVVTQQSYTDTTRFTGSSLRLVLWKHSLHLVGEHGAWLTGVGSGDFQRLLNERYGETGMFCGDPRRGDHGYRGYNPHNQYLEFLLATGFIGLLLFALWLISMVKGPPLGNPGARFVLLVIFASLCLTECMYSANKGITWFTFFIFLFVTWQPESRRVSEPATHTTDL